MIPRHATARDGARIRESRNLFAIKQRGEAQSRGRSGKKKTKKDGLLTGEARPGSRGRWQPAGTAERQAGYATMTAAFAAAAELPDRAGEELRTRADDEERRRAEGRRGEERPRQIVGRPGGPDGAVQPWITPVDHLTGENAAAAYGAPAVPAGGGLIGRMILVLPRQAQPHAPRFLALAQRVVALQSFKREGALE